MRALSSAENQDTAESLLQTVHAFQRQEEKTTIDSEKFYKNWNFKAKRDFLTLSNKKFKHIRLTLNTRKKKNSIAALR